MAVPSSGQLREYADIGTEIGVAQSNVSLRGMSQTAGFSAPDAMSEFYGYSSFDPTVNMTSVTWTGDTTSNRTFNIGFTPDFVWVKAVTAYINNAHFDVVRGDYNLLSSNNTAAQATSTNYLSIINNGFSIGSSFETNRAPYQYVAWCWKMGGTPEYNAGGTIPVMRSYNIANGQSVLSFTGNQTAGATVATGLSQPAELIITKVIGQNSDHIVHFPSESPNSYLAFNQTYAPISSTTRTITPSAWLNTLPNWSEVNRSGQLMIQYNFHSVAGYSKVGKYIGTGANQSINTGFPCRWLMIKSGGTVGDGVGDWHIMDSARGPISILRPNKNDPQIYYSIVSFTSTGFSLIDGPSLNESGKTFLYYAIA